MLKNKDQLIIELITFIFVICNNISGIYIFSQAGYVSDICKFIEICLTLFLMLYIFIVRNHEKKKLIRLLIILAGVFVCLVETRSKMLLVAALLYFCTQNIDYDKVLAAIKYGYLAIILISVILYLLGISDAGIARSYDINRAAISIGFVHPNTAAKAITFFALADTCSRKNKFLTYVIYAISTFVILFILKSRTSLICLYLFLLMNWFYRLGIFKRGFLQNFTALIQPILAIFSLSVGKIYEHSIIQFLDKVLVKRMFLIDYYMDRYNLSLFGQYVSYDKWTCDNTYVCYALEYGVIQFAMYLILYYITVKKAWRNNRIEIVALATTMAVIAFMENGLMDVFVNFSLLYTVLNCDKKVVYNKENI